MIASGRAWGAFVEGRLAALAGTFFAGRHYEDLGVVCEEGYRKRGLSTACTAALCRAILADGRYPSWTTSTDNRPSIRVAQKVGFQALRLDRLFVIGIPVPPPPPKIK
jgi:predicted GNAT family acetyltransferase